MSSIQTVWCLVFVLAAYGVAARFDEDAARQDREAARAPALAAAHPIAAHNRMTATRAPEADAASTERAQALEPEVAP